MNKRARLPLFVAATGLLAAGITIAGLRVVSLASGWRLPFGLSTQVAPTGPVVLQQVQRLQRLETCRYNGQVIVRGDVKGMFPTWIAGDRMLFVGNGEVVAGVDLADLKPGDIRVEGETVSLHMPQPEILHSRLDNHSSRVYERQSGFFTGADPDLETRVRVEAEDRIRKAALDNGVLATAGVNAQDTLRRHLETLGFRQVRFM